MIHAPVVKLNRLDEVRGKDFSGKKSVVLVPLNGRLRAAGHHTSEVDGAVDANKGSLWSLYNGGW